MRHTIAIALAALTAACSASPAPLPIPGTYALIATYPDGNEYVIDYNLSDTDCAHYAAPAARANPHAHMSCAVQPE